MANSPIPQVARQQSRIPGCFDADDDLSPIKTQFDRYETGSDEDSHHPEPTDSLHHAREENSILTAPSEEGRSHIGGDASVLDEREMRRRLMDMDSSFLPQASPAARPGRSGIDDTFVFGGVCPSEDAVASPEESSKYEEAESMPTARTNYKDNDAPESPATPPGMYQTPAPDRANLPKLEDLSQMLDGNHEHAASSETVPSSPTAAAAARTLSRAISMASIGGYETADDAIHSTSDVERTSDTDENHDSTPRRSIVPSTVASHPGSPTPTKPFHSKKDVPDGEAEDADFGTPRSRKRPKVLTSRMASQRSSYTSYTSISADGGSDVTVGADYALQSGGAVPFGDSVHSRPSMDLSRTTSLGSMASGVSGLSDGEDRIWSIGGGLEGNLSTLNEEGFGPKAEVTQDDSDVAPATPKDRSRSLSTPTETLISQHVRDVQVPATMAREYRDRHRPPSPEKRNGAPTPSISHHGKNLTLKEQSSTIDRLMKENWDLKLKISFLNDALNRRSDEGVKAIISENVDLRTAKFQSMTETRDLKRSIRELERRLRDKSDQLAESLKNAKSEQSSSTRDHEDQQAMDEKVNYLRERVMTYEVEMERMRQESTVREGERRRLAEVLRKVGERRGPESDIGAREEMVG